MNIDMSESVRESRGIVEDDKSKADACSAQDESPAQQTSDEAKDDNDDVSDINLKDPELEKVALKMQSKFRFKKK